MRRNRIGFHVAAGLLVAAVVATLPAVSTSASPPERFELPLAWQFPDPENNLAAFVNLGRDAYCTEEVVAFEEAVIDWIANDFEGEPPLEPDYPDGVKQVPVLEKKTGKGAVVGSLHASELSIELWAFDDEANRPGVGACTDTDDAMNRMAVGTTSVRSNDNDLFGSGTRGNAFGDFFQADVTDTDGNRYSYSHRFHVSSSCLQPTELDPPTCLIDRWTLRAR